MAWWGPLYCVLCLTHLLQASMTQSMPRCDVESHHDLVM